MSTVANKATVAAFMQTFGRSAISEALDLMADDATWEVVGKPHLFAGAWEGG